MSEPRIAAFFDFDNTLLSKDGASLGFRYMYDRGEVRLGFILKIILANQLFKRNWMSSATMGRLLLGYYKGRELAYFQREVKQYYTEYVKPLLAPSMLQKVREHKEQGHVLVILSASLRYLLEPVVEDLGFDHLLCTDLELDDKGVCTGEPLGPMCIAEDKTAFARKLADKENLDLPQSYAYSDHHSDIPMLSMVGHPTAVCPDRRLRRHAEQQGWPIVGYGFDEECQRSH